MSAARRPPAARWIAWLAVYALLLNAAMPLFAASAAKAQGRAVGEVCAVWGVRTIAVAADRAGATRADHHAHHHQDGEDDDAVAPHGAGQGGAHCALTSLAALGTPSGAAMPRIDAIRADAHGPVVSMPPARRDAAADWVARRKQGPPAAG